MVVTLELNFIFTDLDVVYLKDPFVALNVPYGVSNVTVSSLVTPEGNTTLASLFDLIPDIVYSTDARTFYHLMVDPYEGNERIPNICGGFVFHPFKRADDSSLEPHVCKKFERSVGHD
ncbi:hypothetical protein BCR33DRAFT_724555 [Rhizoclosmatium globosum]|uniref:Uncharacterized protein n=1 Tax=Rhizoclosmatium globosum TaxID=329046 RepID=A0A1Y2B5F2_9FUNG|nr:hypothetical protein BCR33DRAFT_724555 [Rhizoclosmatium globosum]|eukprot:ORY29936.1 hypothetical protein BCR33DRAFT_724555 [Rhizoclosmatium globosum]